MDAARGQDDERGKIPSFDSVEMKGLDEYLMQAQQEGKYVLIADLVGEVASFMEYSSQYTAYAWCDQVKKAIIAKS